MITVDISYRKEYDNLDPTPVWRGARVIWMIGATQIQATTSHWYCTGWLA